LKSDYKTLEINRLDNVIFIQLVEKKTHKYQTNETMRLAAHKLHALLCKHKLETVSLFAAGAQASHLLAFAEGLILSNYQFLKYFSDADKKRHSLKSIQVVNEQVTENQLYELKMLLKAVYLTRDLVNEPHLFQTALQMAKEVARMGKEAGFSVCIFNKKKIESLKMAGLLAVNKGSIDPPAFVVMEWKPDTYRNEKPLVLVGKGVVFDTGGLSLKPTPASMDLMKSDMGGAATVAGAIYAIAKAKLPVHVVGLLPLTDNRPGGNAIVPSDVLHMKNGKTVEVKNTDAEGRLILADALLYAQSYHPKLVIDLATLTGAAERAIGKYGIVAMQTTDEDTFNKLKISGKEVYERLVEFPLWEEYNEEIKSDIADISNLGGGTGGAITAGMFLKNFTNYPWVHLDIAGTAFLTANDAYRPKNGTGSGVRLLFHFIKNYL